MPIKQAGWKALRKSKKSAAVNKTVRHSLKNLEKKIGNLLTAHDGTSPAEFMKMLYKGFDKAAQRGVISRKAAQRKKSRLMKKLK